MAQQPADGHATEIHASKGGGGAGKWLAGAVVVAALAGGGYYAWTKMAPAQQQQPTTLAALAPPSTEAPSTPVQAGAQAPIDASESTAPPSENAARESAAAPSAASQTQTAAATPVHRRTTRAAATAAPEEVIGVTPASATQENATPQEDEQIIVQAQRRPNWSQAPSAYRLASAYPDRARTLDREGEASLHCTIEQSGALDCVRVSEMPVNSGFGNAALRVAHMYRHAPVLTNGKDAVGSPVDLRVVFRLADNADRRRLGG